MTVRGSGRKFSFLSCLPCFLSHYATSTVFVCLCVCVCTHVPQHIEVKCLSLPSSTLFEMGSLVHRHTHQELLPLHSPVPTRVLRSQRYWTQLCVGSRDSNSLRSSVLYDRHFTHRTLCPIFSLHVTRVSGHVALSTLSVGFRCSCERQKLWENIRLQGRK